MQKKGVSMPRLWPLLLLVTTQLISPVFAKVYGHTSSTVQHYDYDPVSEVATSASSSAFASSLPTASHSATRDDDSRLPVGYLVPSDTIHIVKVVTGPSATPAFQSQTSSTPVANLVRPVAGSDHGASHQARTYDEKPPFWINNEPHDKPAEVLIDIEDNPSDSFPADDNTDGTQSGKTSHNEDPVTPPAAGGLRCQPQAQRIASFSSSSLWGYSVDCGINRMPLEGEFDDHSYCSEAEIQHAQDMADIAALEKAWEISSVQDCQRRAGERRKEKVERREKKQRRGMFLRNAWFRFNKQYEFDVSYTHSTAVTVYLPPLYPKPPVAPFSWPVPTTCPVLPTCPIPAPLPVQPISPAPKQRPMPPTYPTCSISPLALEPARSTVSLEPSVLSGPASRKSRTSQWHTATHRLPLLLATAVRIHTKIYSSVHLAVYPWLGHAEWLSDRVKAQLQAIWVMGVIVYMMLCCNLVEAVISSSPGSTYMPGSFCLPDYGTKPEGEQEEQSAPHSTSADSGFERLKLVIGRRAKQRRRRNVAAAKSTTRFKKHASAMTHPAIDNRRFTEAISSHNSELVSLSEKRSQQTILSVLILVVKGLHEAPTLSAPVPLDFVSMCKPADVSTSKGEAIVTVAGAERLVTNSSLIVPASRATSPLVSPRSQVGQSPVQHSRDIILEEANDVGTDSMSSIAVEDSAVNDSKPNEVVPDEAEEEDLADSRAKVEKEFRANYLTSTDIASKKTEEDVAVTSMTDSVAREGEAHSGYSITTDTVSSETEGEGSSVVQEVDVDDLAARDNTSNETEDAKRSVVESADVQKGDAQVQHPTSSDNTSREMLAESTSSSSPESAAALGRLISNVASNTADQHEVHKPSSFTCLSPAPIDAAFSDTFSKETVEVATEGNPEANVAVASTTSNSTAKNGTEAKSTRGSSVVNEPRSEKPHSDDPTVTVRQQIRSSTSETPASTGASASGAVVWPLPSSGLPGFGWTSPSALGPAQPVISSSGVAFSFGDAGWVGRRDLTMAAPRTHTSASPPAKFAFAKRPKSERDTLIPTGPGSQTSASAFSSISAFQPLTSAAPTADQAGVLAAHASALSSATQVAVTQPQPQSQTPLVDTLATHAPTVRCTSHESQRSARSSKSLLASATAKIKPEENLSLCGGALRSHSSFTSVGSPSATHIRNAERRGIANMLSDLYMSGGTSVTSPRAQASPPVHQDSARLQSSVHQKTTDNSGAPRSQVSHQDDNSAPLRTHARSSRAGIDDAMQKIVLQMSGEVLTNQFPRPTYAPAIPALNTCAPRPNLVRPTRASPSTTPSTAPTEQEIQDRLMNREFREFLNAEPAVASSATEVRRARASAASIPLVTNGNAPRPIRAPTRPEPPVVYGRDPYAVQRAEPVGDVAEDQSSNKSEGESTARRGTYRGTRAGGRVQKRKQNRLKRLAAGENGGGEGGLSQ